MVAVQELARVAYAAGHVVALAAFVYSGLWRRLPMFSCALLAMSVIGLTYEPESKQWITGVYLRVEPLAVLLRFAAAIEVTWLIAPEGHRGRLTAGVALIAFAVTFAVLVLEPGSNVFTFVLFRRYVQIAAAVLMLSAIGTVWAASHWRWDTLGLHSAVLAVLLAKQAAYSVASFGGWGSARQWFAADWPGLLVSSLCCLTWMMIAMRYVKRFALQS